MHNFRLRHEMMASMKVAFICALLATSLLSEAVSVLHRCHISVVDSEGAEIGKAHFFVHRDPSATAAVPDRILDADASGRLELDLPDGFYDVCVMSAAFTPQCRKLVIRKHDTEMSFRLYPSREVLEQQADRFSAR
jgi:hypothetical protein